MDDAHIVKYGRGSITDVSDAELYNMCKLYGGNAREWLRKFGGLLPEVFRRRLYKRKGFCSIHEFAKKLAGMNERTVDRILNLAAKLEDKPALRLGFESGELSWSKVEKVATIATPSDEMKWLEKTRSLSSKDLGTYVKEVRKSSILSGIPPAGEQKDNAKKIRQGRANFSFKVDQKLNLKLRKYKQQLEKRRKEPLCWNDVFLDLLRRRGDIEEVVHVKVCPDCAKRKADEQCGSRHIPTEVQRLLKAKYGDGCAFPRCYSPWEHYHHTRRFSIKKSNDPNFIVPLCKAHHNLMHTGLVGNEERSPHTWYVKVEVDEDSPKWKVDKKVQQFKNTAESEGF